MTPGNRVRRARTQNGLTLRELEDKTEQLGHKVSRNILSKIERDQYNSLSIPQITTLCLALSMSADWWFLGDKQPAYAIGRQAAKLDEKDRQQVLQMIDTLKRIAEE